MSILTINNLEKQSLTLFNIDMQCMGENQGEVDVEICRGDDIINLYEYVSYEDQVYLQFEPVLNGETILKLSVQGSQPELIVQGVRYNCYKTDEIHLYTEYYKNYNSNTPHHSAYNMKIYREAIDQNENGGNPVLLNSVQININAA